MGSAGAFDRGNRGSYYHLVGKMGIRETEMSLETKIKKSELLIEAIGRFPSFHDSEVAQIVLDRGEGLSPHSANLRAKIYVLKLLDKKGAEESRSWHRHLVELRFSDIDDLSLRGFNQQNVLFDLQIEEFPATELRPVRFEAVFVYCYGVEAIFTCSEIVVEAVSAAELRISKPVDEQTRLDRQRLVEEHLRRVRSQRP
jgi:hypothetical protein